MSRSRSLERWLAGIDDCDFEIEKSIRDDLDEVSYLLFLAYGWLPFDRYGARIESPKNRVRAPCVIVMNGTQ